MTNLRNLFDIVFFVFVFVCTCSPLNITTASRKVKCLNIHNTNIEDGGHKYCNCTYQEFFSRYSKENLKLTSFLEKMKTWNCPQFKDECQNRQFDFNRYTFLVYEKFCNSSNFEKICGKKLNVLDSVHYTSNSTRLGMQ